jgi:TRAP transporter 4TM/12TM fusion protein
LPWCCASFAFRFQKNLPDVILAVFGGIAAIYVFANYEHWVLAQGDAAVYDIVIGGVLLLFILEATRRSVSPMLPVITLVFLFYAWAGPYIPGELAHRGFRVSRIIDHIFMSGEGLWSIPLRVSATFVFLFVLFGALMDKTGAGEYLINLSFASMGRYKGGPAKAAVVASAAMGSISGSSIANTVTTGSMTIPLMKKVGFKPHAAGAVEVAASTNGQLMPPIMGAAAFIMAEMIGISYFEVVKAGCQKRHPRSDQSGNAALVENVHRRNALFGSPGGPVFSAARILLDADHIRIVGDSGRDRGGGRQ